MTAGVQGMGRSIRLWLIGLAWLLAVGWGGPARALEVQAGDGLQRALPLAGQVALLQAQPGDTDAAILAGARDDAFIALDEASARRCSAAAACWLRFTLARDAQAPGEWMLRLRSVDPHAATLYDAGRPVEPSRHALLWNASSDDLVFALGLEAAPRTYYLRVEGRIAAHSLVLWQPDGFERLLQQQMAFMAISLGMNGVLLVACLMFWRWFDDVLYLQFALAMAAATLLHLWQIAPALDGSTAPLDLDQRGAMFLLFHGSSLLFLTGLLGLHRYAPRMLLFFRFAVLANVVAACVALVVGYEWVREGVAWLMIAVCVVGLPCMWWLVLARERELLPSVLIVSVLPVSTTFTRLGTLEGLPIAQGDGPTLLSVFVRVSYVLTMVYLIGSRVRRKDRELQRERRRQLDAALDAERQLELQVAQRTSELAGTNEQLRDEIARRHLAERELQQALNSERAMLEQQRQFVAMASHEFRTPLAVIGAAAGSIQIATTAQPALQVRVEKIHRAVARLSGLMENFLAEERLRDDDVRMRLEAVDLREVAQAAIAAAGSAGDGRLHLHVPGDAVMVDGDRAILEVACLNLVQNALRYSPAKQPVDVSLSVNDGQAHLDVLDRGPGIADAERERIFERFYRGAASRDTSGSGLGLFLVRSIARRHRGDAALVSSDATGTLFRLQLPLRAS